MASPFVFASLIVLFVLQPAIASSVGDLLSPVLDDVCKEVNCGKGTCKASSDSAFFFQCECQPGWKQTTSGNTDHFKFMPCVIPNCTLNYSCSKAPAPVQEKPIKTNDSIFDPCFWSQCGVGSCNKTSKFAYNCECPKGTYNLLNNTNFPCFEACEIGMDCTNLGISLPNQSSSPPQTLSDNSKNQASSIVQGHTLWLIITMASMAMVLWEYNW
ncbi:hypothetical protein UlMin_009722 [Ulmus minor]